MAAIPSPDRLFADLLALLAKKRKEKPLTIWSGFFAVSVARLRGFRWGAVVIEVIHNAPVMISEIS
ncbi:hypothetical protein TH47_07195 [Thalassospira sp. MCCC 1A02803]|nr:hypothetical protein AUQ41_04685 [Thalassospira sp. MCCC 1A02898]ONH88309.1 hypothetical protein TH47_07195 [Thalassospira sp. MCCC 1A02803]